MKITLRQVWSCRQVQGPERPRMWENLGGLLRDGGLRTRPQNASWSLAENEGQEEAGGNGASHL